GQARLRASSLFSCQIVPALLVWARTPERILQRLAWSDPPPSAEEFSDLAFHLLFRQVLGEHQFADQNLAGVLQHLALAGGQALVPLPHRQVANDLGHLEDVAALDLLQVGPVAAVPVLRHGSRLALKHLVHLAHALGVDDLPQPQFLHAAHGDHDAQISDGHPHYVVALGTAQHLFLLDGLDDPGPVHRVDDLVANPELLARLQTPSSLALT